MQGKIAHMSHLSLNFDDSFCLCLCETSRYMYISHDSTCIVVHMVVFCLFYSRVWCLQRQPGKHTDEFWWSRFSKMPLAHWVALIYSVCVCVCVSQGKVWLIDLNPFGEVTDSLLFTWEELTSGGEITQQQVGHHDTHTIRCKRIRHLEPDEGSENSLTVMRFLHVCRTAQRSATPTARWRCSPVPVWATESHGTLLTSPPEKTPTNSLTSSNW